MKKQYAERDARKFEPHYSAHVSAMTEEGLHSKSDIAAELAFRDLEIVKLNTALARMELLAFGSTLPAVPQQKEASSEAVCRWHGPVDGGHRGCCLETMYEVLNNTIRLPTEQEALGQLTEKEVCEMAAFMPNLACLVEREPPSHAAETRAAARMELAVLLRRRR